MGFANVESYHVIVYVADIFFSLCLGKYFSLPREKLWCAKKILCTLCYFVQRNMFLLFNYFRGDCLSVGHPLHSDVDASLWLRQLATAEVVIFRGCDS